MKHLFNLIVLLCLIGAGFLIGKDYAIHRYHNSITYKVRVDTVTVRDTITNLIPKYITILRTDTLVTPKDTIYLPIEQKTVIEKIDNDSVKGSIKAVFSGFDAVLDTLQYDLQITNKTLYKRRKLGFTIGVSSGIGYDFNNKVTPYIGVGVTWGYNF